VDLAKVLHKEAAQTSTEARKAAVNLTLAARTEAAQLGRNLDL
jgi:hypothetical protein